VATDIPPVHALVAQVMEGVAEPDLILPPGASPHDHALRPSEAAALEQADFVFWIGDSLTPWLAKPIETLAGDAAVVVLSDLPDTRIWPLAGETHDTEHSDEHGHDYDPHLWLDPGNGKIWLSEISAQLAQADPENADIYRQNSLRAQGEIDRMVAEVHQQIASVRGLKFITYHASIQYFERAFSLPSAGAIVAGDAHHPGPAHIDEMRKLVSDQGVRCLLSEPGASDGLIANVTEGSDVRVVVADPLGSTQTLGPELYTQLFLDLAQQLVKCQ